MTARKNSPHRYARQATLKQARIDRLLPDGTAPIDLLGDDLTLIIPNSLNIAFNDEFFLIIDGYEDLDTAFPVGGAFDPDHEFKIPISKSIFPPAGSKTTHTVDYSCRYIRGNSGGPADLPFPLILDLQPPGNPDLPLLTFTEEQLTGITLDDLSGDELLVLSADWALRETGDILTPSVVLKGQAPETGLLPTSSVTVGANAEDQLFAKFPLNVLAGLGNNVLDFSYQLTDRAGNTSVMSPVTSIPVVLTDPPKNLLAPVVPEFVRDGLITDTDARAEVEIEIPPYDGAAAGQRIYVNWGSQSFYGATLEDTDLPNTPLLTVYAPYKVVLEEGSATDLKVTYEVFVGTIKAATSPAAQISVDLTTPGGEDPDPETPEHENLLAISVTSASGAPNSIPAADYDNALNASGKIPHRGEDGVVVWEVGDIVSVIWKDTEFEAATIVAANLSSDLTVTIPGNTIKNAGVGQIDVSYRIARPLNPPPNQGVSVAKAIQVPVASIGQLPGGGATLAAVTFPSENIGANAIQRATVIPENGTNIKVAIPTNIKEGDKLSLRFYAVDDNDPGLPEVGYDLIITNQPVTSNDLSAGFILIHLSFDFLFLICDYASFTYYSFTNDAGTTSSESYKVYIALRDPRTGCEWPLPPAV